MSKSKQVKQVKPAKAPTSTTKGPAITPAVKRAIVANPLAVNCPVTAKLTWLVAANPKRPGSASHTRAQAYWGKSTVASYLEAGASRIDLAWDAAHGFFSIQV